MPRRVLTTPEADWYEAQRPGLGPDFLAEVAAIFSYLEAFPEAHAAIRGETRRAIVHRFPYSAFYVVDPDSISVTGVLHFRRDPNARPGRADV
jgi:plasmid stabilization system protein ParE